MSNHLTDKEIGNIISGLSSANDMRRAEEHMAACPQCRKTLAVLSSAVSERPAYSAPGEHVRNAVMDHWHRVHNETAAEHISEVPAKKRFIPGLAFAASMIIAISLYMFLTLNKTESELPPLTIKTAAGEVYVNDSPISDFARLKTGSVIKTGEDGTSSIYTEGYTLHIAGSTSVTLSASSRIDGIRFILNEGTVISKSSGELYYSFRCAGYSVSPAGTEFMLNLSGENLTVAVAKGKVLVSGSGLSKIIPSGRKWSSGNPNLLEPIDEASSAMIASGIPDNDTASQLREKAKKTDIIKGEPDNSKTVNGEETRGYENIKNSAEDEKHERIKLNRELREDIDEIKKEQRRERNGRNR